MGCVDAIFGPLYCLPTILFYGWDENEVLALLWCFCKIKARSRVSGWSFEDPSTLKLASHIWIKIYGYNMPQMLNNLCL